MVRLAFLLVDPWSFFRCGPPLLRDRTPRQAEKLVLSSSGSTWGLVVFHGRSESDAP